MLIIYSLPRSVLWQLEQCNVWAWMDSAIYWVGCASGQMGYVIDQVIFTQKIIAVLLLVGCRGGYCTAWEIGVGL